MTLQMARRLEFWLFLLLFFFSFIWEFLFGLGSVFVEHGEGLFMALHEND